MGESYTALRETELAIELGRQTLALSLRGWSGTEIELCHQPPPSRPTPAKATQPSPPANDSNSNSNGAARLFFALLLIATGTTKLLDVPGSPESVLHLVALALGLGGSGFGL